MHCTNVRKIPGFLIVLLGLQVGLACSSGGSDESTGDSSTREAKAHLVKAQRLLEDGAIQSALARTDSAAAISPEEADIYFLRGRILSRLTRYDEANSAYQKALSLEPDRQGAWFNIGNTYFRRKQFRKALNRYSKEEENHPTPSLYVHMAQAYSNLDKADSAKYAYEKALDLDSSYAPAHAWLGQLYRENGQFEEALDHTQQALDLDSTNLKYRFFLGQLLLSGDQPAAAVEHLQHVAREQPWHDAAYYNLGRAYARLGRQEEAQNYLARADTLQQAQAKIARLETMARENPDKPGRWLELAETLQRVGRFSRAKEAYSVALSLAPESVAIRNNLANIAMALGDTTEALSRYRAILEKDSTHADVWLNLGVLYAKTGRRKEAIKAWKQALRYEPGHPTAKAYLTKLSEAGG